MRWRTRWPAPAWPTTWPGGGQFFAIFADGHNRLPKLTGGPFRYKTYAADTLRKSIGSAHKPMKQAVIAPSMLALLYPLQEEVAGLHRKRFEEDLVNECEKDIRQAFAAGAVRVSVDFTEGRLATRADPRNPWTGAGDAAPLHRAQQPGHGPLHGGRAPEHRHPHLPRRGPGLGSQRRRPLQQPAAGDVRVNAGYFLIQLASERDKDPVYESIGQHSRDDADGVAQVCFVGVINPGQPAGREARRRFATPSSGPPTSSRRSVSAPRTTAGSRRSASTRSPTTARPTTPGRWPSRRSANRVEGTKMAAEKLGVS